VRPGGGTASGAFWVAAEIATVAQETPRVRTLELVAPGWPGHRAGQHLDVRLTAEDGYQAQRSYSIASAPGEELALTVERLDDGEVSPYLVDEAREGDMLEVRGPIGGYFVWDGNEPEPVLLVAGGSGVVPLMAMARHRARNGATAPMRLLLSSRTLEDVIYRDELERLAAEGDGFDVVHTLTREQPPGWTGYARRIDSELLAEVAWPASEQPRVFVCGSTRFVDAAADGLLELGYEAGWIRTERFGATGS
jgi:ferredoxin-NADP reductase